MASASTSWGWGGGRGWREGNVKTLVVDLTRTEFRHLEQTHLSSIDQSGNIKLLSWHCFIRAALLLLLEPVIYRVQPGSNSAAVFLQIILHSSLLKRSLAAEVLQLFEGIRSPSSGGRKQVWLPKSMRACEAGKMSVHRNTLRWAVIFWRIFEGLLIILLLATSSYNIASSRTPSVFENLLLSWKSPFNTTPFNKAV